MLQGLGLHEDEDLVPDTDGATSKKKKKKKKKKKAAAGGDQTTSEESSSITAGGAGKETVMGRGVKSTSASVAFMVWEWMG